MLVWNVIRLFTSTPKGLQGERDLPPVGEGGGGFKARGRMTFQTNSMPQNLPH